MQKSVRLTREMEKIKKNPPAGIDCCYSSEADLDALEANVLGPAGSPYEKGLFKIEITVPNKYPFEPPTFKFTTKVYHPNIDVEGRICLDLLKVPPAGSWKPTVSLANVLVAIQMLLANPNPDDPLMAEIGCEFKTNRAEFERKAKEWTVKYASYQ